MFRLSQFDQDISGWDVSSVTSMSNMFLDVTLSTANYNALLSGWSVLSLQNGVTLNGGNSQYCTGAVGRQSMIYNFGWTITDGGIACGPDDYFVTTWKTDNPGETNNSSITIPTEGGNGHYYDVDWDNDGIFDTLGVTGNIIHDFGTPGTYTVQIRGAFPRIGFSTESDRPKIISIDQWGTMKWTSMASAFIGCYNLIGNAPDTPDLSGVTSMQSMFQFASLFNQDISG
jgi:surface protein